MIAKRITLPAGLQEEGARELIVRSEGRERRVVVTVGEVVDACLQVFGGYGYMLEYPISRAYMDARVQRIYAGTNEIMKTIIAKQMDM